MHMSYMKTVFHIKGNYQPAARSILKNMREKFAIYISERSLIFKTCKEMKNLTLKKLNLQLTSELMR